MRFKCKLCEETKDQLSNFKNVCRECWVPLISKRYEEALESIAEKKRRKQRK